MSSSNLVVTSDRMETCNGSRNSSSRITPSPPQNFPAPKESSRSPKRCTSTGYRRSSNSTSPIRVFVMCVWTPDVPCQFGPAPEPPAIVCVTGHHLYRIRVQADTHFVITPSCDGTTITILTASTEGEIICASLTGCASIECPQHDIYDTL